MADKVLCDKSDLVNIADAVRSKLGVTDTYYVSELSYAIQNIQTGGGSQTGVVDTSASYTMIYTYFPDAVSVTVPTRVVTATSAAGELQIQGGN